MEQLQSWNHYLSNQKECFPALFTAWGKWYDDDDDDDDVDDDECLFQQQQNTYIKFLWRLIWVKILKTTNKIVVASDEDVQCTL